MNWLDNFKKERELMYLSMISNGEYQAEVNRAAGPSGVLTSRQYDRQYANDIGFSPLNIHNHSNYYNLVGMAEFSAMVNGYYLRTRHNDYRLERAAGEGSNFLATNNISYPAVPSDVTGDLSNQIEVIKKYLQVLAQKADTSTVADAESAFKYAVSYLEAWFEPISGDEIRDTFFSERHQINTNSLRDLINKDQYYTYGGHKNQFENIPHLPVFVKDIDENGDPVFVILKYRICTKDFRRVFHAPSPWPVSSVLFKEDRNLDEVGRNLPRSHEKYRIRPALNYSSKYRYDNNYMTLTDWIMRTTFGLDGEGSTVHEEYTDYNNDTVLERPFGAEGVRLNSSRYHRLYKYSDSDAANRRTSYRTFSDSNLFVSMNTRPEVFAKKYGDKEYRFSYAIPLELHVLTFLPNWNPLGAINAQAEGIEMSELQGKGDSQDNPLDGYHKNHFFYRTPVELFQNETGDVADTGNDPKWVKCQDGTVNQFAASGHKIFLPEIQGVNNGESIRTRYPVYPVRQENDIFKRIEFNL